MEVFKTLNGIKTRLLLWSDPFSPEAENVIVIFTGNPGIIDVYYEFGSELNEKTGLPICIVGHGGHEKIADEKPYSLKSEGHLFGLQGQVKHKLDLINNVINKRSKLHFIGHSIGAWMIIDTLQKDTSISVRVTSVNLLFPTLQKIALTKNGYIINIVRQFHMIIKFLLILLSMLPESLLKRIAGVYVQYTSLPSHYTNIILKFMNAAILERVLYLAYEEMDNVTALDIVTIDKVKHKTTVIYGEDDGWVPHKYMEDLKQFEPFLQMMKVPYKHEFVLKSSKEVAELVSESIKARL